MQNIPTEQQKYFSAELYRSIVAKMQNPDNKKDDKWIDVNQHIGTIYYAIIFLKTEHIGPSKLNYLIYCLKLVLETHAMEFPNSNIHDDISVLGFGYEALEKISREEKETLQFKHKLHQVLIKRFQKGEIDLRVVKNYPFTPHSTQPSYSLQDNLITSNTIILPTSSFDIPESSTETAQCGPLAESQNTDPLHSSSNILEVLTTNDNASQPTQEEVWDENTIITSVQQTLASTYRKTEESWTDFKKRLVSQICQDLTMKLRTVSTKFTTIIDPKILKGSIRDKVLNLIYDHFNENKSHSHWPSKKIRLSDKITWEDRTNESTRKSNEIYDDIEKVILGFFEQRHVPHTLSSRTQSKEKKFSRDADLKRKKPWRPFLGEDFDEQIRNKLSGYHKHPDIHFFNIMNEESRRQLESPILDDPFVFFETATSTFPDKSPLLTQNMPSLSTRLYFDILNPINEPALIELVEIINDKLKTPFSSNVISFSIPRVIKENLPIHHKQINNIFIEFLQQAFECGLQFEHKTQWIIQKDFLNSPKTLDYIRTDNIETNEITIQLNKDHALMLQEAVHYLHQLEIDEGMASETSTIPEL